MSRELLSTGELPSKMDSGPEPHNGHRPTAVAGNSRADRLARRVLYWVDRAVARLLPHRKHRALLQRVRELDDRLERAAQRLTHRHRRRSGE